MSALSGLLKWLVVLLVLAHLALAIAWLARPYLRTQGLLPPVLPERLEVGRQALPAATQPAAETEPAAADAPETAAAVAEDSRTAAVAVPESGRAGTEPPETANAADGALACAVLGPFADQAAAQAARESVERDGGAARLQVERTADYLVFVPPAPTTKAAGEIRAMLRRHGLDAYVIPSGERRNGVSIGVFRDRDLALAQQRRAAEAGQPAQLATRDRAARYRLLARAPAAALAGLPQAACGDLTADTPDRP